MKAEAMERGPMRAFSVDISQEKESLVSRRSSSIHILGTEVKTICFCIPLSWIMQTDEKEHDEIKNSDWSTIFLLLNSMIGSGIVVQPFVFSQSGIVVCVFLYVIIAFMNYIGVNLLIVCAEETKVFDFSKLAETILGKWGGQLVDASMVVGGIGSTLSYILIIGTLMRQVTKDHSGWYANVVFLTLLPVVLFTVPLCLLRNFGHLAVASMISIVVIMASVALVIIGGPIISDEDPHHYRQGNFLGTIRTVGDIVFALGYIQATFHAYNAMENRAISNFKTVTMTTTALGATLCFFTGLAGYLSFGENVDTNVIENFAGNVGGVFKVGLVIHLILYIPGDFVIMRAALLKLWGVSDVNTLPNTQFLALSLGLIGVITLIAIILQVCLSSADSLGIVVDITGGVAGSILYFLVPGLCSLKQHPDNRESYWKSVFLVLFGSLIIIFVIISNAI